MSTLLKWQQPQVVTDWERQNEGAPATRKLISFWIKTGLVISVVVLVVTWIWLPSALRDVLRGVLAVCVAYPALFLFQFWISYKLGVRYIVNQNSIRKYQGQSGVAYLWKEVESYHFENCSHAENVRSLVVEARRGKRQLRREFYFDPREVDEQKLTDILQKYIAQNAWSSCP